MHGFLLSSRLTLPFIVPLPGDLRISLASCKPQSNRPFIFGVSSIIFHRFYSDFFFSSRRRHTRYIGDCSSDVCSSDLLAPGSVDVPASSSPELDCRKVMDCWLVE